MSSNLAKEHILQYTPDYQRYKGYKLLSKYNAKFKNLYLYVYI